MKALLLPAVGLTTLLVYTTTAGAQSITWIGGNSNNSWNDGANWSDGNPVSSGQDYIVSSGTIQNPDGTSATFTGKSLAISGGATLVLKNNSDSPASGNFKYNNLTLNGGNVLVNANNGNWAFGFSGNDTTTNLSGANTITLGSGNWSNSLNISGSYVGNGSLTLTRTSTAGNNENSGTIRRNLNFTNAADFSGYTGDIFIGGLASNRLLNVVFSNASGWGSGNLTSTGNSIITFNNALDTLSILTLTSSDKITLNETVSFSKIIYEGQELDSIGNYDVTTLNSIFSTTIFNGTGNLAVIPEPSTYALIAGIGLMGLYVARRRKK